jgi:hypothetical protein
MQDVNEILVECVKALGGSKVVGAKLFPDLLVDKAQRKLLDCLNPERDHKLSPEQAHLIMRWSHDIGYHDGWYAYCDLNGYGRSEAIKPKDEQAELQRKFVAAVANMQAIAKQLGVAA